MNIRKSLEMYFKQKCRIEKFDGGITIYFDVTTSNVVAISTENTMVLAIESFATGNLQLMSFLYNGQVVRLDAPSEMLSVIPNARNLQFFKNSEEEDELLEKFFPCVYTIISYGILDYPMLEGVNFSRSKINVLLQKVGGNLYEAGFQVGDNVFGGSKVYSGSVIDGYKFFATGFSLK